MTLDVHSSTRPSWSERAVLLAILAVRVSVGVGLPSLLIYLRWASRWGIRLGVAFNDAEVAHALGFAALIADPGRRWPDHPWKEFRPVDAARLSLATIGVAVSVLVTVGSPLRARAELGARRPARRDHLAHRRRRGVLGAAPGAAAPQAHRRARGRVGLNDAPTVVLVTLVTAGAAHGVLGFAGEIVFELGVGVLGRTRCRVRRSLAAAPCRAPPARASTRWPCCPSRCWRTPGRRPARLGLRRGLRRRADPRQRGAAAPGGHPVVLGGRRLAGPDRALRDARPARPPGRIDLAPS